MKNESKKTHEFVSTELQVDHVNLWVENPDDAMQKLIDVGFSMEPDSLSFPHYGQGTAGRYFYFLNGYLELIFVNDHHEFIQNGIQNPNMDFSERANFMKNDALPFSIALKLNEYKVDEIPFQTVKYQQKWMGEENAIYASKSSKKNLREPSLFVIFPDIESGIFESMSDLDSFPTENDFWKAFFKHPNGAEKITKISITSSDLNLNSNTIRTLNNLQNVTIRNGEDDLMELYFDHSVQKKTIDLRPELPLIIYL